MNVCVLAGVQACGQDGAEPRRDGGTARTRKSHTHAHSCLANVENSYTDTATDPFMPSHRRVTKLSQTNESYLNKMN